MSITDELRKWGRATLADTSLLVRMEAIADRIDAEHEAKVAEVASGWDYWESTHVELPKDVDGEPIRVGDVMEWPTTGETFEVVGIGEGTLFYVEDGSECADWTGASTKRHYHAPTVEDVLREFANEVYADADNEIRDRDFLCAKYAKRLRLAEEEDA